MADFETAYQKTLAHEGGYANDADDFGGETYKGISRVHHPSWPGWKRVDTQKNTASFPRNLRSDQELQVFVREFYKQHFWDRMLGDKIPDQAIATELFDTAVNMGMRRAVRFLQESLNLLDRKPADADIAVDGWLGRSTIAALRENLKKDRSNRYLMTLLNIFQGYRYIESMRAKSSQEKFARGWLSRVAL